MLLMGRIAETRWHEARQQQNNPACYDLRSHLAEHERGDGSCSDWKAPKANHGACTLDQSETMY